MSSPSAKKSRGRGLHLDMGGIDKHPRANPGVKSIKHSSIRPIGIGFENIIEFNLITPDQPTRLPGEHHHHHNNNNNNNNIISFIFSALSKSHMDALHRGLREPQVSADACIRGERRQGGEVGYPHR
jgi:hypothetical protein